MPIPGVQEGKEMKTQAVRSDIVVPIDSVWVEFTRDRSRQYAPCKFLLSAMCMICLFASTHLHSATPSVLAGGAPYGGSFGSNSAESPTTPLFVTYADTVGANSVFSEAVPGRLKANAEIMGGVNPWDQSLGKANFIDHFHLNNPSRPDNSTGSFFYTFFLTGSMSIKQDSGGIAAVSVNTYSVPANHVGYLEVAQLGSTARLYGLGGEGGGPYPLNNIFAEPDGSMKVYATTTAVAGSFTFYLNFRVDFEFVDFPYNQVPEVDDFSNRIQFELSTVGFVDARSDFSATFEFAEQNPIIPNPFDPTLPAAGWVYTSSSGEIPLPPPLSVATTTGTGDAMFGSDFGLIENLTALDESAFPWLNLINGSFPDGFFSFDITGLEAGEVIGVGIDLPTTVSADTLWWFYDPTGGWSTLPTAAAPGTGFVYITASDGLPGDFSENDGTISLLGGPGVVTDDAIFVDGFETAVTMRHANRPLRN